MQNLHELPHALSSDILFLFDKDNSAMGEWSDYFEDFPEENPANYDNNGRYLNEQQRYIRDQQRIIDGRKLAERKKANPNQEIAALIRKAIQKK